MSFLLNCPNCGQRSAYEFQYGGEVRSRPGVEAQREAWTSYVYWRANSPGVQKEWWNHKLGCRDWFLAERNTTTNKVIACYFPEQDPRRDKGIE
jgi:heterotetrameric sarcosine oxidase delta subunit